MQNVGYFDEKRLSIDANLMLIFYSFIWLYKQGSFRHFFLNVIPKEM